MFSQIIRPKYYIVRIKELIRYIVNPICISEEKHEKSISVKLVHTFQFAIINIILSLAMFKIILLADQNGIIKYGGIGNNALALSTLYLPLIEEIIFRLYLKLNRLHLFISIEFFVFFFSSKILNFDTLPIDNVLLIKLSLMIAVFLILYLFRNIKIKKISIKYFRYIYYTSAIIFGFAHLVNHDLILKNILFLPLLTLPQIVGGLITGYFRITYGFFWSTLLHYFHNFILMLPVLLLEGLK